MAGAARRGGRGRLHSEEVTLSCDVLSRCPALWMTSALSLTTPLSPHPQLCPGLPMFPLPGPAWLLEVPPFPASPGPELRVRWEQERAHPHTPLSPGQGAERGSPRKARCPAEKGISPGSTEAPSSCVTPGSAPSSVRWRGSTWGGGGGGEQRPFLKFSNFLTHLDAKLLKMLK